MNSSHIISRKVNRFKRLTAKLKAAPTDDNKKQRKQELAYELAQAGVKV
jgi:hypothetical protein